MPKKPVMRMRCRDLRRKYGITAKAYAKLWQAQGGLCAICNQPEVTTLANGIVQSLAVDHDHATGKVRGLLCRACNTGLGLFQDNTARMLDAVKYLMAAK